MGWQAHRGEPAQTSVAKTGDAPSRLRTSQLTPLNTKKASENSKSQNHKFKIFACPALYTYVYRILAKIAKKGYVKNGVPDKLAR